MFVSSIPNIYQLWNILHTNLLATATWKYFKICQSMLANTNTEEQRQQVAAQERADNDALARVCQAFRQCRWDNYAVYNTPFSTADVSTVLLLHPPGARSLPLAIFTVMANAPESLVATSCLVYVAVASGLLIALWTTAARGKA